MNQAAHTSLHGTLRLVLFSGVLSLGACAANGPHLSFSADSGGSGRHLQQMDISVGTVSTQMVLPNPESCTLARIGLRKQLRDEYLKSESTPSRAAEFDIIFDKVYRCSADDKSTTLPFRATQRLKNNGLLVDIYAASMQSCTHAISYKDSNIETVAECARYKN